MNYISAGDKLLEKYCIEPRICFWGLTAMVNPNNTNDIYFFDCSLYSMVDRKYSDKPDVRIVLSYKSPISLTGIRYGSQLEYNILPEKAVCSKDDIENCIRNTISELDRSISETLDAYKAVEKKRDIPFIRTIRGEIRGEYYGLLTKKSILMDLLSQLGYDGLRLDANVKPTYVLYSVDLLNRDFKALIIDKAIKLNAHKRMIDINILLESLSSKK